MFPVAGQNATVADGTATLGRRAVPVVAVVTAVAVIHAVMVGRHTFVGSFDDDASYILVARALAHGQGLTSKLGAGYPLIGAYPPGYSALLAPLALISGTAFLAFRSEIGRASCRERV